MLERVRWSTIQEERGALSERELERASRFVRSEDRARFVAGRTLLRTTLARELRASPSSLDLRESEHGKPYVAGTDLAFNLSHAGAWLAFAFTWNGPIGVDVEHIGAPIDLALTAPRVFTARELEILEGERNEISHRQRFFTLWTMKEAALKTWGTGLSIDPRELEVEEDAETGRFVASHPRHPRVTLEAFACDVEHFGFVGRLTKKT